jgi:DNA-3-methyladenine glycosylase I
VVAGRPDSDVVVGDDGVARCWWATGDPLYEPYHDNEWGRPVGDDVRLFEKLSLEGFQSGLSWLTILRKRENFRHAFKGFEIEKVARFRPKDVELLLSDSGIVRNRAKIEATINNARRCVDLVEERGSFAAYVWGFEPEPAGRAPTLASTSEEATAFSKDLRRRGWKFVGPTTAYAFMQAMGLVNDHLSGCDIRDQVDADRKRFPRPTSF